mmetsp:Transcript_35365/g.63821  ORF Transcript_35365/g.63821 Transcript_35365/m.63821 type:complete len:230 (-) Transcript_35365:4458-5147(-)
MRNLDLKAVVTSGIDDATNLQSGPVVGRSGVREPSTHAGSHGFKLQGAELRTSHKGIVTLGQVLGGAAGAEIKAFGRVEDDEPVLANKHRGQEEDAQILLCLPGAVGESAAAANELAGLHELLIQLADDCGVAAPVLLPERLLLGQRDERDQRHVFRSRVLNTHRVKVPKAAELDGPNILILQLWHGFTRICGLDANVEHHASINGLIVSTQLIGAESDGRVVPIAIVI